MRQEQRLLQIPEAGTSGMFKKQQGDWCGWIEAKFQYICSCCACSLECPLPFLTICNMYFKDHLLLEAFLSPKALLMPYTHLCHCPYHIVV